MVARGYDVIVGRFRLDGRLTAREPATRGISGTECREGESNPYVLADRRV